MAAPVIGSTLELLAAVPTGERVDLMLSYVAAVRIARNGPGFLVPRAGGTGLALTTEHLALYVERYPELDTPDRQVALLSGYTAALEVDPSLTFAAYAADFFGDELIPAEPVPATQVAPEPRTRRSAHRVNAPLPGQLELPLAGDQQEAAAEAVVLAAERVAAGTAQLPSGRLWAVGQAVRYKAGRKMVVGTVVRDHGDGTIDFAPTGKDLTWHVIRDRCGKLKTAPAEVPAPDLEAVPALRYTLAVPATEATAIAAHLATPFVRGYKRDSAVANFTVAIPDGGSIVVTVRNGTRKQCTPYVSILVIPDKDDALPSYEHPPQTTLLGEYRIQVDRAPAILEITTA